MPKSLGGDDSYQNMMILHQDVHRLVHATNPETICKYLKNLSRTAEMMVKINKLRKLAKLDEI